jgi:hypothetical protein
MSTKDRVFDAVDLFYEILDFSRPNVPFALKSVSKIWHKNIAKYRFNLWISVSLFDDPITDDNKWDINETNIPQDLINGSRKVRINGFNYSDIIGLETILGGFSQLQELDIDEYSPSFPLSCLQSIKTLTIRLDYSSFGQKAMRFDGTKLELMETLNIHTSYQIYQDMVELPPNLTTLKVSGGDMILARDGKEYFPETLTRLDLCGIIGAPSIYTLPENLRWFKTYSGVISIPPSVTSLHAGGKIEGIKYENLHTLVLYDKQDCTFFNFRHITTLKISNKYAFNTINLPSTLTELDMAVDSYRPLRTQNLPYSLLLLRLAIQDAEYQPRFSKLPPRLRVLNMEYSNKDIARSNDANLLIDDFPDSLTELNITCKDIKICQGMLPQNLRSLSIQADLFMSPHSIPDSVTSLTIPLYSEIFERNVLPNGLTYLQVNSMYETSNALKSYFPPSLIYIHCFNYKVRVTLPFEVKELNDGGKCDNGRTLWKLLLHLI